MEGTREGCAAFERCELAPDEEELAQRQVDGPRREVAVEVGGRSVIVFPAVACDGLFGPTGGELWEASVVLSRWLARQTVEADVVELGSGLGLAGLAASWVSTGKVWLTDNDEGVLANLRRTVEANSATARVAHLDWTRPTRLAAKADVLLLAAACVYTPHLGRALAETIALYVRTPESWAVVVQRADRPGFEDSFLPRLAELGLRYDLRAEGDGMVFCVVRWQAGSST